MSLLKGRPVGEKILLPIALLFLVSCVFTDLYRIPYSFEVGNEEGSSLVCVMRLLEGDKLYVRPSADYVGPIYTPLYYYVSAVLAKVVGVGFASLRWVSFLSTCGSFILIGLFVRRETGRWFTGLMASGLFAATYEITGAWFAKARVDNLFLFLVLAALYLLRFGVSNWSAAAAGMLLSLAFLTKQPALIIACFLIVYCFLFKRRSLLPFTAVFVITSVTAIFLLDRFHDGWFFYYAFILPSQHPFMRGPLITFWTTDILAPFGIAFLFGLFYFFSAAKMERKETWFFYLFAFAGFLASSWLSRMHLGSFKNTLLPAYALIAILFGLGWNAFQRQETTMPDDVSKKWKVVLCILCVAQFLGLIYNPLAYIPSNKKTKLGHELVETIKKIDGEVFFPYKVYIPVLAGKKSSPDGFWVADIVARGHDSKVKEQLVQELKETFQERRYSAVILPVDHIDPDWPSKQWEGQWWNRVDLHKYYDKYPAYKIKVTLPFKSLGQKYDWVYLPKE